MNKIILIRHAKSSWKHNVIDHERPLNKRGIQDASLISNSLKKKNLDIDLILSSDAIRAKLTACLIIEGLNKSIDLISYNHNLYDFSGYNLIEVVKNTNNTVNTLMIFGHNHAITSFVNSYGNKYIENVPTCGVVILEFDIEKWSELNKGKTIFTLFPRDLKE